MQDKSTATRRRRLQVTRPRAGFGTERGVDESAGRRILVVDNDMSSADALERMLHASGFSHTRVAYSGEAALTLADRFRPSIVLLDLSLLDMTGYDLAESLRNRAQGREMRLIALTSSPAHATREQARAAGFERYLVKPIASLDLSALVEMPSR